MSIETNPSAQMLLGNLGDLLSIEACDSSLSGFDEDMSYVFKLANVAFQ